MMNLYVVMTEVRLFAAISPSHISGDAQCESLGTVLCSTQLGPEHCLGA